MRLHVLAFCFLAAPATAQEFIVQFADGAPKDRITFQSGGCDLNDAVILIDLTGSQGGLIFDVTAGGSGVEVYQPVEITNGYGALSEVRDGDQRLQILVHSLAAGDTFGLSADLDDTLGGDREITVNGSEMAGASVSLALNDRVLSGVFDTEGTATIALPTDANICIAAAN